MLNDLPFLVLFTVSFMVLFALSETLFYRYQVQAEISRKLVHLGTGLLTLLFPLFLTDQASVLLLCSGFLILLIISTRYQLLRSIHAIDRQSYGSFAYPVAVYVCFLAYQYSGNNLLFFYLPVLTLAICDPLAALCGRRWPRGPYRIGQGHKSLMGSSMFFLSSTLLTLLFLARMSVIAGSLPMLGMAVTVSLTATLAEAFSGRGLDNVTIPLAVLFILSFFNMLF